MRPLAIAIAALSVAVTLSLVVGVLALLQVSDLATRAARDATETHGALCVLRTDLERRVNSSLVFLRDHPGGFAGIDAKTIRDGVANQQRTIAALSVIDCHK